MLLCFMCIVPFGMERRSDGYLNLWATYYLSFFVLQKLGIFAQLLMEINLEWLLVEYIFNATLHLS